MTIPRMRVFILKRQYFEKRLIPKGPGSAPFVRNLEHSPCWHRLCTIHLCEVTAMKKKIIAVVQAALMFAMLTAAAGCFIGGGGGGWDGGWHHHDHYGWHR
jgi:hypothetical protein